MRCESSPDHRRIQQARAVELRAVLRIVRGTQNSRSLSFLGAYSSAKQKLLKSSKAVGISPKRRLKYWLTSSISLKYCQFIVEKYWSFIVEIPVNSSKACRRSSNKKQYIVQVRINSSLSFLPIILHSLVPGIDECFFSRESLVKSS